MIGTWYHSADGVDPEHCPHCGRGVDDQYHNVRRGRPIALRPSGKEKELDVWTCKQVGV